MNLKIKILTTCMLLGAFVFGQNKASSDSLASQQEKHNVKYRHFIGSSLFMVMNFFPDPADYYLLNYGYRLTQKGFQLYLQLIAGYRFEFFKKRLFVEPAYALKYWPIDTNFPADFAAIEKGAPKYKFEPSLNFGFRF